jgi:serine O-acetyltransferase
MSIKAEIENILEKDPAARSWIEVLLCYPGLHAIMGHKLSSSLWQTGNPVLRVAARFVSQTARFMTGIEIHPGARLGKRLFIDHGMGVVIGETAVVGDDCTLYHGVTLGAQAAARMGARSRDTKRHPTLGNNCVVGSGAQILGGFTVGDNVQVASCAIVVKEIPDNCTVAGVPARIIYRDGRKVDGPLPDIEAEAIKALRDRITVLEEQEAARQAQRSDAIDMRPPAAIKVISTEGYRREDLLVAESDTTRQTVSSISVLPSHAADPVDQFLWGAGI